MTQRSLFDHARTVPTACPVGHCPAIRLPDQRAVVTCAHDQQQATSGQPARRPRGCLNTYDPSTAPFPKGF